MDTITLKTGLRLSRIVFGHWRLAEWNLTAQDLVRLTEQAIELGITSIDHADIYGNYSCEKLFGDALKIQGSLRNKIQLITKCGIKLVSDKFPDRKLKVYDYTYDHIVTSVDNSLRNFGTDYVDLLLLHRPAPFFDPAEVARAFRDLKKAGKVLHFGVSNFTSQQYEMLNSFVDQPLATNQVEISPYCLEHWQNGNIEFFLQHKINPMAWSPLAGGNLLDPKDEKGRRLYAAMTQVGKEIGAASIDSVAYSWLLSHPAGIIPITGTGKLDRLKTAVDALKNRLNLEQWYAIYMASTGQPLP